MARETITIEIRENRNGYYFYSESGKWLQGCKRQYLFPVMEELTEKYSIEYPVEVLFQLGRYETFEADKH